MDAKSLDNSVYAFAQEVSSWANARFYSDFKLATVKLDWSSSRKSHRGGMYKAGPGINLAMRLIYPYTKKGQIYRFYEYPSYDADRIIGGFYATDPFLYTKAVICHEIAHSVQYFHFKKTNTRGLPHGTEFKRYYASLRINFINPYIPKQNN